MISMSVQYTNQYAARRNRKADVSTKNMKCFLSVLLVSGYCRVSKRRMYQENRNNSHNHLISNAINRDR